MYTKSVYHKVGSVLIEVWSSKAESVPAQAAVSSCPVFSLSLGKKVQLRKPAPGASDTVPSRIRPTPVNLANAMRKGNSAVSQRPCRDRVIHLLALKPYKKPELILRLQKDGLSLSDKDSLDSLLQQVALGLFIMHAQKTPLSSSSAFGNYEGIK